MKNLLLIAGMLMLATASQAQLLKKLKQKAESAVSNKAEKELEGASKGKNKSNDDKNGSTEDAAESNGGSTASAAKPALKVFSKFDFVPGTAVLYYDNFEKDNIGEAPAGWITSTSAEVVSIEGFDGNWVKMHPTSSEHIVRNKKQSWGNNFTVEFDLLMIKGSYDPRLSIFLMNTSGKLVADEAILQSGKKSVLFDAIMSDKSRITLTSNEKKISDIMSADLSYASAVPVHVSICVQGKRFRMWWNEKKIYDAGIVQEDLMPNQLGFSFGSLGGFDIYVSNIRVAKDVPDTRAAFEEGKVVSNLLFYTGTAKLRPESMGALLDVSKVLKDAGSVKIIGHTDSDGDDAANQQLSQDRAEAVKHILADQYGISQDKLSTEGRGETQPIADNKTPEGKAQNRRVEFIFKEGADKYVRPAGVAATQAASKGEARPTAKTNTPAKPSGTAGGVVLQSKLINITLPYAQFMKSGGDGRYTFTASKEEGNSKENFFTVELQTVNMSLKPETFNFKEVNQKNELYGTKKFSEIQSSKAVLYYGNGQKPYIYRFSPIVANGHMANYVSESLARKLPPVSQGCKLVIEKVEGGKASGYFVFGMMSQGLNPIRKGDAMRETFTDGFSGELKGRFVDVPVL